jgi:hypothetical protein
MSFGQDFLRGFAGPRGLKDYAHASKTFLTNGYELVPNYKFMFHVKFNLNTTQIPALTSVFNPTEIAQMGLMVKNVQLPQFTVDTEVMNQYNRKRIIQKRVNYQPVQIEFHDDGGDLIRTLWYNWFSYYYKDPVYQYGNAPNQPGRFVTDSQPGFGYGYRDTYEKQRSGNANDWGYMNESYYDGGAGGEFAQKKPYFFSDITIYGLTPNRHKWISYVLINPMIRDWRHDQYNYTEGGGTMSNFCTIEYETVKYYSGGLGGVRPDTNVKGFGDPAYYDTIPSSLSRPGSGASVLGQGGLLDAGIGIAQDLQNRNFLGAALTALTTRNTWKGKNLRAVINEEANVAARSVIQNSLPGAVRQIQNTSGGFLFPRAPTSTATTGFGGAISRSTTTQ